VTAAGIPVLAAASGNILLPDFTLVVELVVFLGVLWLLSRFVYPPLALAIKQRQEHIAQSLRDAVEAERRLASVRDEVERMLEEARAQAREIGARSHRDAAADADEVRARARQEAAAFVEQARADIVAERDRALRELRLQFGALVVAAAAKVLGEAIDPTAHHTLIERSLHNLETLH
jgi:F-type H+-transporting ATPase subunit b